SGVFVPLADRTKVAQWQAGRDEKIEKMKEESARILQPARVKLFRERLAKLSDSALGTYLAASPEEQKKLAENQFKSAVPPEKDIRYALDAVAKDKVKEIEKQISELQKQEPPFEWALAVKERGRMPRKTNVLVRGVAATPGAEVQPAFLTVLGGQKAQ